MPDSWKSSSDIPDSATTVRDSIFHEVRINDEGHKENIEDEVDPSEKRAPLQRNSSSETDTKEKHDDNEDGGSLHRKASQAKEVWKFRLRPADDDEPEDWWFASTAIPLLAATLGPMANVFSIAALISTWRADFVEAGIDDTAIPKPDPTWCINLNAASLALGFLGNFFLLCNFTQAIRYIVALPATIVLWFFATGILTSITICMSLYDPALPPAGDFLGETYTEGFWYAVIASVLYFLCSLLLMINMLGYALGHYREHFELDDEQRNLILQTMMFFLWLAGGAGVFARTNEWTYADSLYYCDVTILTVGFGDFYPTNDLSRGLVFPFSVGGIIILGLVVSSISRFAMQLGADKVVRKKLEKRRLQTVSMTVSNSKEKEEREALHHSARSWARNGRPVISAPFDPQQRSIAFDVVTPDIRSPRTIRSAYARDLESPASPKTPASWVSGFSNKSGMKKLSRTLTRSSTISNAGGPRLRRMTTRSTKLRMLRDERARFNEMRHLQDATRQWKKYMSLIMSVTAFSILWCGGAAVFNAVEQDTYFEALYFCYVSLLTIGYGDLSPKSNLGKAFFVLWSLCAIPTMTILISNMGDTIIASYKRGTFKLGDWTLLPKKGFAKIFLKHFPRLQSWIQDLIEKKKQNDRLEAGFPIGPASPTDLAEKDPDAAIEQLASHSALDEHDLAQKLVDAIRETADHLKAGWWRQYTYEEWVEYTRLIRFTQYSGRKGSTALLLDEEEVDEGIIEWDWIGEDSPMMSESSETEWILDRLMESLDRYMRRQIPALKTRSQEQPDRSPRRRSTRAGSSGSISVDVNKAIENTGFVPVTLLNPSEGPRLRSNSARRRSLSPRSLHRRDSNIPGTAEEETEGEERFFKPRPQPLASTGTDSIVPTAEVLLSPPDPAFARQRPSLPKVNTQPSVESYATASSSRHNSEAGTPAAGSRHASYSAGPGPASSQDDGRRRNTVAPGGTNRKKQPPKRRQNSGQDGMTSLTAMRLRRG